MNRNESTPATEPGRGRCSVHQVAKEVRSILPTWILTWFVPCAIFCFLTGEDSLATEDWTSVLAGAAYAIGAAILGANAFGAEFTYRTLPLLLVQPVPRSRLFLSKLAVLAGALLTSALPVLFCAFKVREFLDVESGGIRIEDPAAGWQGISLLSLTLAGAALNAICAGPLLSMLTRSALAGAVFTLAVPVVFWVGGQWLEFAWRFLTRQPDMSLLLAGALGAYWAVAFALGYRRFLELEAADGLSSAVQLCGWRGGTRGMDAPADRRPGRWYWMLLGKELHLQEVTLIPALLFCLTMLGFGTFAVNADRQPIVPTILVYSIVVSLLAGALPCAEERQLGALEWHLSLPVRVQTQCLIKFALALTVGLLFAVGLPWLLLQLPGLEPIRREFLEHESGVATLGILSLVLTVSGLYASSLAGSSVRAVICGLPLAVAFFAMISQIGDGRAWAMAFGLGLMLWMAFTNFRTIDRTAARVQRNALVLAAAVVVVCAVRLGLDGF